MRASSVRSQQLSRQDSSRQLAVAVTGSEIEQPIFDAVVEQVGAASANQEVSLTVGQ